MEWKDVFTYLPIANKVMLYYGLNNTFGQEKDLSYLFAGLGETTNITNAPNMQSCTNASSMYMQTGITSFNSSLTSTLTDASDMFLNCVNLTTVNMKADNIVNAQNMFAFTNLSLNYQQAANLNFSSLKDATAMFMGATVNDDVVAGVFPADTPVETMANCFAGCEQLTDVYLDEGGFEQCTNFSFAFSDCPNLTSVTAVSVGGDPYSSSMRGMFYNCVNLVDTEMDIIGPSDMGYMFYNCAKATDPFYGASPSQNTKKADSLFRNCSSMVHKVNGSGSWHPTNNVFEWVTLESAGMMFMNCNNAGFNTMFGVTSGKFNTPRLKNAYAMFSGCSRLKSHGAYGSVGPAFDIVLNNCTNCANMYAGCYSINAVPTYNMASCTDASYMFYSCSNLKGSIILGTTSNLKSSRGMFDYCSNLSEAPQVNMQSVTDASYMFGSCSKISNFDNYQAPALQNAAYMYSYCSKMRNAPSLYSSPLKNAYDMFYRCTNLVNVPKYNGANLTDVGSMFAYCNNLSSASISNIMNMLLEGSGISRKNLSTSNYYSPFYSTNITNSRYSSYHTQLTAAGWTF